MTLQTSTIKQPESTLLERCKKGDEMAFKNLVEDYQQLAYNLAWRILLDDAKKER